MNRTQATSIGVITLAGLMLRPIGPVAPDREAPLVAASPSALSAEGASIGTGPWVASCKYWAATRALPDDQLGQAQSASGHFTASGATIDLQITAKRVEVGCSSPDNRWGFPKTVDAPQLASNSPQGHTSSAAPEKPIPHVTALIAVVPDPVRTHQALNFDRTIDSIVEAAAANSYVSSYYWLPWKLETERLRESNGTGTNKPDVESVEPDNVARREPGLMIFKPVPHGDPTKDKDAAGPRSSFYRVIDLPISNWGNTNAGGGWNTTSEGFSVRG